ncbi:hypothetical protein [Streptosporangium sp. NPDC023615]|uniref:hypothetical protein n=1 Tax=Streptosporangium sp. NPDC023615 TaxID=3154794 RepID=UPI0034275126
MLHELTAARRIGMIDALSGVGIREPWPAAGTVPGYLARLIFRFRMAVPSVMSSTVTNCSANPGVLTGGPKHDSMIHEPMLLPSEKATVQPFLTVTRRVRVAEGTNISTPSAPTFFILKELKSSRASDNLIVTGLDTAISHSPSEQAL